MLLDRFKVKRNTVGTGEEVHLLPAWKTLYWGKWEVDGYWLWVLICFDVVALEQLD